MFYITDVLMLYKLRCYTNYEVVITVDHDKKHPKKKKYLFQDGISHVQMLHLQAGFKIS